MPHILTAALALSPCAPPAVPAVLHPGKGPNAYVLTTLVSNRPEDKPRILDPLLRNGWGVAIRPPGAGGHFWISNAASGTTTTYVGDVPGVPLYQDDLKVVPIPSSRLYAHLPDTVSQPTGQVYTGHSSTDFQVSGEGANGECITGASKFVFVTLDGTVAAWRDGMTRAVTVVDESADGAMFSGVAVTELPSGNRLYAVDFNTCTVHVYDHEWKKVPIAGHFHDPAVPSVYAPYNIQHLGGRLYTAFARLGDDPGEEDQHPGYGYVAAFDLDGRLVQSFEHRMELNAPWGLAIAPAGFGALSGALLVANFGDGRILAFDRSTGAFIDYVRGLDDAPIEIDGAWGMIFGNGVRLGYANHLYVAAGPNSEEDGRFVKLAPVYHPCRADFDGSGAADHSDALAYLDAFFNARPAADADADGEVTPEDLTVFTESFEAGCGQSPGR